MKNLSSQTGASTSRILLTLALCAAGSFLALAGVANPLFGTDTHSKLNKDPARATLSPPAATGPIWSLITSPNANAVVNGVSGGVACVSETNCFAVGSYNTGLTYQTLIEQWNGSSWSVVPSPNASFNQENRLYAVTLPFGNAMLCRRHGGRHLRRQSPNADRTLGWQFMVDRAFA